jgi:hypothetical protein
MKKYEDEIDEPSPLDEIISKLHSLNINALFKYNQLLRVIELNRNINTVDENKKTVLHHLINRVDFELIDQVQLKEIVDIIKDITPLMSERALHLPDKKGVSALQLAADCRIPEIYYAAIGMGLPDYETPYFGKPAYNSSFKDCRSSSEVFSSFAKSAWDIEIPSASSVSSTSNDENSKKLIGGWEHSEGSLFY